MMNKIIPLIAMILSLTAAGCDTGTPNVHTRGAGKAQEVPTAAQGGTAVMASLGDSITAATFAETTAHGTSTQQDFNANSSSVETKGFFENKADYSWSSGQRILSQQVLLSQYLSGHQMADSTEVLNVSVPGAVAADMTKQAQEVVDSVKSGKYTSLKYVTFFIGANDACSNSSFDGTPNDSFKESLKAAFDKLAEIQQSEPIRIMLVGIPKIPDLGFQEIRQSHGFLGATCEAVRGDTCGHLIKWTDQADYEAQIGVIVRKNQALQEAASQANQAHANLQVVYTNKVFETPIKIDYMAGDCFHPNAQGQEKLSTGVWADQPWFK